MKTNLIKFTLWLIIIFLAYFGLYGNITNEIHVRKVMDDRKSENIQRLKDLREIQLEYKRQNGTYTNNPDSLVDFLFNTEIEFINSEKAEEDSIAADRSKWNSVMNKMVKNLINSNEEAKRIYKENGGEWIVLTEKQKIDRGYIAVDYYVAYELCFTEEYKKTRNNSYILDTENLNNVSRNYKKQKSYSEFKTSFSSYEENLLEKIELRKVYFNINSNINSIFDLDSNTIVSVENLQNIISSNSKEISKIESNIFDTKDKQNNAEGMIRSAIHQRNTYTETVGADMIVKVREKAKKKAEKGKVLKGRKGIIYSIISSQDSTEKVNKEIVSNCKDMISNFESELEARKQLIKIIERNYQTILDIQEMQNQYSIINGIDNTSFDSLAFYTINEEVKVVTTLKKGSYTIPNLPYKWKQARLEADFLVEQAIEEKMLSKIKERYIESGGDFRDLTSEEGYARGLITTIIQPVKEVIFDNIYLKNRIETPLKLDSIIFIPYTTIKYDFAAREFHPNLMEQAQGEIDKYYFKISASYDDVFHGLDKENEVLRKNGERENIQVGSLEKTITNGNWGE
tara:strand:+ start:330 stop:2039 length:1710 start_codon:yes stop_codon:yes gene_type:complete